MRIAILADIHSNLRALEAVADDIERWRPDVVVVAGDIINRGPMPVECLQFVQCKQRDAGWLVVRGNHEDYVIEHSRPETPVSGPRFEIIRTSHWTYRRLGGQVDELQRMPFFVELDAPASEGKVRIAHASMRGIRDGVFEQTPDHILAEQVGDPAPALFVVGHTHVPLTRMVNATLVVNVGATGLPFDHDVRPAHGRVEYRDGAWRAEVRRIQYDHARAERDYFESGFLDEAGPLAELILEEHRRGTSCLFQWVERYLQDVLAGRITVAEAACDYLATRKR